MPENYVFSTPQPYQIHILYTMDLLFRNMSDYIVINYTKHSHTFMIELMVHCVLLHVKQVIIYTVSDLNDHKRTINIVQSNSQF